MARLSKEVELQVKDLLLKGKTNIAIAKSLGIHKATVAARRYKYLGDLIRACPKLRDTVRKQVHKYKHLMCVSPK